jgi:hypothetical protein
MKKFFFQNLFLSFLGKSILKKTIPPKNWGPRCLGELGVSEGPKPSEDFFTFFSLSGLIDLALAFRKKNWGPTLPG